MQVKAGLDTLLLPRTREIEQEVSTMQQEANTVTNKSKEEQADVEEELARMAKLVFTFQVCKQCILMHLRKWLVAECPQDVVPQFCYKHSMLNPPQEVNVLLFLVHAESHLSVSTRRDGHDYQFRSSNA